MHAAPFDSEYRVSSSIVTENGQQDTSFIATEALNLYEGRKRPAYAFGLVTLSKISAARVASNMQSTQAFQLHQNYPNPFNPKTVISYLLPYDSFVKLSIYSILGQKLETLISEQQQAGDHRYEWDANEMASGLYFYKIQAGEFTDVKKMILLQ